MREGEAIIGLIGKSVNDPDVEAFLEAYEIGKPAPTDSFLPWVNGNKEKGIYPDFTPAIAFEREFLPPPWSIPEFGEDLDHGPGSPAMELRLSCITFDKAFEGSLPFGLKFSDSVPDILFKWGKPKSRTKSTSKHYEHAWYYYPKNLRILLAITKEEKLMFMRVWLMNNVTRRSQSWKERIKTENKNLNPGQAVSLIDMRKEIPSDAWAERMEGGDDLFNPQIILSTRKLFRTYLDSMAVATRTKKAQKIYSAVKKLIKALNRLNAGAEASFIETLEREEICDFVEKSVRMSGFQLEEGEDITEEWREW